MISCGFNFTFCVDDVGSIWSFGENDCGQLGTGNTTNFNVPQKVLNIPPVVSIYCGFEHTLIITIDSNLWSCGRNGEGQLCLRDTEDRSMPQQTSFSNILKISASDYHSLFQNNKKEIFVCGNEEGYINDDQITPSLISNAPSNIVHFICGYDHNLFLDSEGNVYSIEQNCFDEALGHSTRQNVLKKIPNIPPIKLMSCVSSSYYLIDFEGNLWSFGSNDEGQLGHGSKKNILIPEMINTLKDIQQISCGSYGEHFFAKNSQKQIFATGRNDCGQLGIGEYTKSVSVPKEINSQYSAIWGDWFYTQAKSARK